jgi:serine-type D-Ala-D-Ala carboxypeptidase/endopeptidase (penicillin-binding protein 4)
MVSALAIIFTAVLPFSAWAADVQPWETRLQPILGQAKLPPGTLGIEIREVRTGRLLFARDPGKAFNPASAIKLLTTAAALSKLGPDFRFETALLRAGDDVCLRGGGDPSLVSERMWMLVEEARGAGLRDIAGDLVLDASLYPREEIAETFEGDSDRAFTAPISSLSINYNSLTIRAEPGEAGKRPRVWLEPDLPAFELRNEARVTTTSGPRDLGASIRPAGGGKFLVKVWGKIGLNQSRITLYRGVPEPSLYAGHVFLEHLRRAGGAFRGRLRMGACPAHAREILRFPSVPLSQIVFGLNKFSNNIIAEMLLRALGKEPTAASGTAEIRSWLERSGIPAPELVLANASGLSRENRVSARTLVAVVLRAAGDLRLAPEFLSSLGILGTDGTVKRRLKGFPDADRVRAKSGSLSGIVTLAGVAAARSAGDVAFAFLFNGPPARDWDARQMEDDLLAAIIADGPQ